MTISSQDNVNGWSKAQWVANARNGFLAMSSAGGTNTKCVSFTGSHISNVRVGAAITANQVLFSNNQIDHFGDDGIDYAASNIAITKNNIHDNLDIGDGNHEDAMQGVIGTLAPGVAVNHFQNVLIDSNLVIRQTDPSLSFPTYLQGIDASNSDWTNVTVTNNVVVTSACWAISFSSIHNGLIANNTVVEDGLVSTPGCAAGITVGNTTYLGEPSSNTAVRNNLASRLSVDNRNSGVVADHNVGVSGASPQFNWYVGGVPQFYGKPGIYDNGNIIDAGGVNSEFVNFNPATLTFNVMLKAGAQAIGPGTTAGAASTSSALRARLPMPWGPIRTQGELAIIARTRDLGSRVGASEPHVLFVGSERTSTQPQPLFRPPEARSLFLSGCLNGRFSPVD